MISPRKYQLFVTLICSLGAEQGYAAELGGKLKETAGLVSAIAKVFGALAVVVALMMLLVIIIKKLGLSNGLTKTGTSIKIIETRMVAPKKYIAIAQIAGKHLALGITDNNINLLTELNEEDICIKRESIK